MKIRAEIKFKNALLFDLLVSEFPRTYKPHYGLIDLSFAADVLGMHYQTLLKLLTLKVGPYKKEAGNNPNPFTTKVMTEPAKKLCGYFNLPDEVLFPPELYHVKFSETLVIEREVPLLDVADELIYLPVFEFEEKEEMAELVKDMDSVLQTLSPREEQIVRSVFGIGTNKLGKYEAAERFGVTYQRIYQIKDKALRKLRHPSRSCILKAWMRAGGYDA